MKTRAFLFVDVVMTENKLTALLDTRASHNFLDEKEAGRLGVHYSPSHGTIIKTANLGAKKILGITTLQVRIDDWTNDIVSESNM